MKKVLTVLLIILFLVTGCKSKKLTEIFDENNYINVGGTYASFDMSTKIGKVYAFDATDANNNYFGYSDNEKTAVYYYNKDLIRIDECTLNVEDNSYSDNCNDDEVSFLKRSIQVFKEENNKLGITKKLLNITKDKLS